MAQIPPGEIRVERALGLIAGTVSGAVCFIVSFFLVLGSDMPTGLPLVFVTLTVIASLIPISIAGVRLALVIRHAREHGACVLPAPGVVNRSIVCAFIVNLVFIVLGSVASMGWLLAAVVPYLLISAVPLACTAAILGWGAEKLLTARLANQRPPTPTSSAELTAK